MTGEKRDAIIVGGGIIGLALARRLATDGMQVVIVERETELGRGASWAAGGMLAPSAEAQFGEEELVELGNIAVARYGDWISGLASETGIDANYLADPTLVVAVDRDDAGAIRHLMSYQEALGLPVEWLTPSRVRELEPWIGRRLFGGVISPGDHRVDNRLLVKALVAATESNDRIEIRTSSEAALWLDGGTCRGVAIGDEYLEGRAVIVTAGAWSASVAGLPEGLVMPVRPVKGQMLCLAMEGGIELRHTIRTPRVYLVPRSDGRLVVGATSEEKGFDTRLSAGGMHHLLDNAYEIVPAIYELPLLESWTGLRPGSRDNLPILGPSRVPGLWWSTGHYRNGILLAEVSAELVASHLRGGPFMVDPQPFHPARFGA